MEELNVNFTIEQNEPLVADFEAFDEPPTVEVVNTDYELLENKSSINDVELVGNKTADELGLALTSDIPDLTDYVKNTDYATGSKGGVIKTSTNYGTQVGASGSLYGYVETLVGLASRNNHAFISKGTLENIKDDYVKRGVTTNTIELTEDEKANAKQWLGYADNADIMTAIASIPQFKLSIVEALPETGEKMTLYLVPKEGTESPDVYNEYIWIEQTSTFEFLGTTAVDLTDYVKNTDYAGTDGSAGLIKTSSTYGTQMVTAGYIRAGVDTLESYNKRGVNFFISKGTLDNVLTQYSKTVLTTQADYDALATKDANTLYLIEEE